MYIVQTYIFYKNNKNVCAKHKKKLTLTLKEVYSSFKY